MENLENVTSKKKRIRVQEGLYDFTVEEIEFIHLCRSEYESSDGSESPDDLPVSGSDESKRKILDEDIGSDTESIADERDRVCMEKQLEDSKSESFHLQYTSKFSTFNNDYDDDDSEYPDIESSRVQPERTSSNLYSSPVPVSKPENQRVGSSGESSSDIAGPRVQKQRKKILVPEPELSDPNFPGLLDESNEEETESGHTNNTDYNQSVSLSHKLTTFGSFRRTVSGGFFGSYVVRSSQSVTSTVQTTEVRRNGYFRIWFNKLRNLHLL